MTVAFYSGGNLSHVIMKYKAVYRILILMQRCTYHRCVCGGGVGVGALKLESMGNMLDPNREYFIKDHSLFSNRPLHIGR